MLQRLFSCSVAGALMAAATLSSCRTTPPASGGLIDPALVPAFQALEGAVNDHQDELAERIVERILARSPEGAALAKARAFRRVLDGRELARSLSLQLIARPLGDGVYRVRLDASYPGPELLQVTSGPGRLRLLLTGIDPGGFEQRSAVSDAVFGTEAFEIRPGEVTRIRLGDYELPTGTAMAVRATWNLMLVPGEIRRGTRRGVPINDFAIAPGQVIRLAPYLPAEPVDPAELVRYLQGPTFSTQAMLERAVRIAVDQRESALSLLTPVVAGMTRIELERVVPALRWLSGNRDLGGDPGHWRVWMAQRGARLEEQEAEVGQNSELVLPPAGGS